MQPLFFLGLFGHFPFVGKRAGVAPFFDTGYFPV
jgi:hypothetical protein